MPGYSLDVKFVKGPTNSSSLVPGALLRHGLLKPYIFVCYTLVYIAVC